MESAKKVTGRVLRIERSSLHDGDGLRTVVFLKGCPLSCLWCSTPESQHSAYELGFRTGQCVGCAKCASVCPGGAITMKSGVPERNPALCSLCFACERACPNRAWQSYGRDMTADELAGEIAKDEIFYFHSGGGVTFSGGEPLLQAAFVSDVMQKCHEHGIHTAMETSLYAPWRQVAAVMEHLDFLFADIKLMDSMRHLRACGVENGTILENLRRVDEGTWHIPVRVRIPVIPGINNDRGNLKATVKFCDTLKKVSEIELLPYHRLGMETYRNLKRSYKLSQVESPTAEEMGELADYMNQVSNRVRVWVGG